MNLTETPEVVIWPETEYVFVEKSGPFQETAPKAWGEVHPLEPKILEHNTIVGCMALYKVDAKIYRAGVALVAKPVKLPESLRHECFKGGKYSKFVLTGAYSNLPQACGRVFEIVQQTRLKVRDDFCIENYVNDPRKTPEGQLITEILIPTM